MGLSSPLFEYVLPVIRGIQAGREYYVSMCPVRFLPKLFPLDEEEIPPEMRGARTLNPTRIPEIARYILNNPTNYTFAAIAASIDADITFEPAGTDAEGRKMGRLRVPMDARFTINDGRHRRAALELALKENPELGYETIAVILFLDIGLKRSQQLFHDLNAYGVRPDSSLNILYNHRDEAAMLVKAVVQQVPVFRNLTEMERSTLSTRSGKLFTLNTLYNANLVLLTHHKDRAMQQQIELAVGFWNAVSKRIPDWQRVLQRLVSASEVRRDFVHCQAIAVSALGEVGATLLSLYPQEWEARLDGLREIDWSRSNPDWDRRIFSKGGFSQSRLAVGLISRYLKRRLDLPLTPDEEGLADSRFEGRE